ncbi:MAG TPA: hypothetical protein VK464_22160 [Symbiobacteriaceae bacterium]|jgi:hypothetical protein|nr:hypothetical protein [Symbiobacteriaceae bacterium]
MVTRWAKSFAPRVLLLFLLLVATGWVVVISWGNPWVRLTMSGRVSKHLSVRYPETRFTVTDTGYDFFNRRYVAHVRSETEPAVTAIVVLSPLGKDQDDYLEQKLKAEMVAQLTPVVKSVLSEATVTASVRFPDGRFSDGPEVKGEVKAAIRWDLSATEPKPFVEQATAVLAALRQSGLRVDECSFWGNLGDRSYALDLTEAQMAFTSEQLLPLVRKPGKW